MSRFKNEITHLQAHIRTLRLGAGALVIVALVMGGAILVGIFAFALAKKRTTNFLGGALNLPKANHIDRRLVIGSMVFGAGWGLAGFCPGPGFVSMFSGQPKAAVFVLAMVAGMVLFEAADRFIHQPRARRAMNR